MLLSFFFILSWFDNKDFGHLDHTIRLFHRYNNHNSIGFLRCAGWCLFLHDILQEILQTNVIDDSGRMKARCCEVFVFSCLASLLCQEL